MRFRFILTAVAGTLFVLCVAPVEAREPAVPLPVPAEKPDPAPQHPDGPRKPNVLVIVSDDQRFGDLSSTGNRVLKTPPPLARLAKQ
jgi:hypothetical protein